MLLHLLLVVVQEYFLQIRFVGPQIHDSACCYFCDNQIDVAAVDEAAGVVLDLKITDAVDLESINGQFVMCFDFEALIAGLLQC